VQTTVIPGHRTDKADERFFPVTIQTSIPDPFSASGVLTLNGSDWENKFSGRTTVLLHIPAGGGEYSDRDDPSRGTTGNKPYQEVWRDNFVQVPTPFGDIQCTKHLFVKDGDYRISGVLNGDQKNGVMKVKLDNAVVPSFNTDDDGCSFGLGAIIGTVTEIGIEIAAPFATGNFLGEWHTVNQ